MKPITSINHQILFNNDGYCYLNKILSPDVYSKIFILVDENTANYCLPSFLAELTTSITIEIIELESGESNKNIASCMQIWESLNDLGADRKSIILNLGGGVITDIGGFIACTYKRGIAFINIPTTLLGMVDAAIGGKNGIDLGNLKNQIGIIREPKAVTIITSFLETLPPNQMRSGLAEIIKHGLIADKTYWNTITNLKQLTLENLDALIYRSVEIKNTIVCQDTTEEGIRKALNFGHTVGHAIESLSLQSSTLPTLLHGDAVAIGIIIESYIAKEKNLLNKEEYAAIKTLIFSYFNKVTFTANDIEKCIELMAFDKKNEFGTIQFAILNGIGNIKINETCSNNLIFKAFENYNNN